MDYKMNLTQEELDILNGSKGEAMAKVMKTLVMYGDAFGATKMVPVTSKMGHLGTSFGLKVMKPVYDLMDQLIAGGALSGQKFTVDPKPLDPKVPANLLQKLVFNKFMYSMQDSYDAQLTKLGLLDSKSYTCTCYMDEVGKGRRSLMGRVLGSCLCKLSPRRALQQKLRHNRAFRLHRRLRPLLRSAD